jgi:uncharacterized DUF497 family protein
MEICFDADKNEKNKRERGLACEQVADFDFATAIYSVDNRKDYGEIRYRALGFLGDRIHALVFAERENGVRVISFRKANEREVKHYAQARDGDSRSG